MFRGIRNKRAKALKDTAPRDAIYFASFESVFQT